MIAEEVKKHPLYPTDSPEEWNKDHREFVVHVLLPMVHARPEVDRIIREAYEAGFEAQSNGSSVVPDLAYDYGNIKDPMGVAHDYLFDLHQKGLADKSGHKWTLWECNRWYYRAWCDFGHPWIGRVWWTGLFLGSWVVWNWGGRNGKRKTTTDFTGRSIEPALDGFGADSTDVRQA